MQSGISFNVPSDDCGELARARTLVGLDVMPPATSVYHRLRSSSYRGIRAPMLWLARSPSKRDPRAILGWNSQD